MKTIKTSLLLTLFVLATMNAFAQIKVNQDGRTYIGRETDNPSYNDPTKFCTTNSFGVGGDTYRAGAKISFGDFGTPANGGANAFVGEFGAYDSDILSAHGRNGIYFTVGGGPSLVAAKIEPSGELRVYGNVTANDVSINSDIRLKKNIKYLTSADCLSKVRKLNAIAYDYKTEKEDSLLTLINSQSSDVSKYAEGMKSFKKDLEKKKSRLANQIGFSAQEVQIVLPELVRKDNEDMLAVNYSALTPILVESIKEQQAIIDAQKATIDALQKDITAIKLKLGMR